MIRIGNAYVSLQFVYFVDILLGLSGMHQVVSQFLVDLWKIVDARSFSIWNITHSNRYKPSNNCLVYLNQKHICIVWYCYSGLKYCVYFDIMFTDVIGRQLSMIEWWRRILVNNTDGFFLVSTTSWIHAGIAVSLLRKYFPVSFYILISRLFIPSNITRANIFEEETIY